MASRGKGNHKSTAADAISGRAQAPTQGDSGVASGFKSGITNMRKAGVEPKVSPKHRGGGKTGLLSDVGSGFGPGFTKSG